MILAPTSERLPPRPDCVCIGPFETYVGFQSARSRGPRAFRPRDWFAMHNMADISKGSVRLRRPTFALKLIRHFGWRGNQNKSRMWCAAWQRGLALFCNVDRGQPVEPFRVAPAFSQNANSRRLKCPHSSVFVAKIFPVFCAMFPCSMSRVSEKNLFKIQSVIAPGRHDRVKFPCSFPCLQGMRRPETGLAGLRPPPGIKLLR